MSGGKSKQRRTVCLREGEDVILVHPLAPSLEQLSNGEIFQIPFDHANSPRTTRIGLSNHEPAAMIGPDRDQRRDRADAQNVSKERPAQTDAAQFQAHDAPARAQIERIGGAARRVIEQNRDRASGDPEPWKRTPAENEKRRQRNQNDNAGR